MSSTATSSRATGIAVSSQAERRQANPVSLFTTPFSPSAEFRDETTLVSDGVLGSGVKVDASFVPPTSNLQVFQTQSQASLASIPAGSQVFVREGAVDYLDYITTVDEKGNEISTEAPVTEKNLLACGHAFTTATLIRLADSVCPICRAPIQGNNLSKMIIEIHSETRNLNKLIATTKDSIIAIAADILSEIPDELYRMDINELANRFKSSLTTDVSNSIREINNQTHEINKKRSIALQVE